MKKEQCIKELEKARKENHELRNRIKMLNEELIKMRTERDERTKI